MRRNTSEIVQDALQYDGAYVRSLIDVRAAGHHCAEVPRSAAAGCLRSLRVSTTENAKKLIISP